MFWWRKEQELPSGIHRYTLEREIGIWGVFEVETRENIRRQIISQFAGLTIDMNYMLCIPSVHATYQTEEIVVDFSGGIREVTDNFPREKAGVDADLRQPVHPAAVRRRIPCPEQAGDPAGQIISMR